MSLNYIIKLNYIIIPQLQIENIWKKLHLYWAGTEVFLVIIPETTQYNSYLYITHVVLAMSCYPSCRDDLKCAGC
jgi:hypothetical protein